MSRLQNKPKVISSSIPSKKTPSSQFNYLQILKQYTTTSTKSIKTKDPPTLAVNLRSKPIFSFKKGSLSVEPNKAQIKTENSERNDFFVKNERHEFFLNKGQIRGDSNEKSTDLFLKIEKNLDLIGEKNLLMSKTQMRNETTPDLLAKNDSKEFLLDKNINETHFMSQEKKSNDKSFEKSYLDDGRSLFLKSNLKAFKDNSNNVTNESMKKNSLSFDPNKNDLEIEGNEQKDNPFEKQNKEKDPKSCLTNILKSLPDHFTTEKNKTSSLSNLDKFKNVIKTENNEDFLGEKINFEKSYHLTTTKLDRTNEKNNPLQETKAKPNIGITNFLSERIKEIPKNFIENKGIGLKMQNSKKNSDSIKLNPLSTIPSPPLLNKDNEETAFRKKNLGDFIVKMVQTRKQTKETKTLLSDRRRKIKTFYEKEILKINKVFSEIIRIFEKNKMMLLEKIKHSLKDIEQHYEDFDLNYDKSITDLDKIQKDITSNMDNILNNMDSGPFHLIMGKYNSKLEGYEKTCEESTKEPLIINKIEFYFQNFDFVNQINQLTDSKSLENASNPQKISCNDNKFEDEIWSLFRPFFSINRIPINFAEENNIDEQNYINNNFTSPSKKFNKENFFSFKSKDLIDETNLKVRESINSPQTQKYLTFLNKISSKQESNNTFFSNVRSSNMLSPKLEKCE